MSYLHMHMYMYMGVHPYNPFFFGFHVKIHIACSHTDN